MAAKLQLSHTYEGLLYYAFRCLGCAEIHIVRVHPSGAGSTLAWGWNLSLDAPTFTPSILQQRGHYAPGSGPSCWCTYAKEHPEEEAPFTCSRCHSFITDGKIQYLTDCTHVLAGKTIDLPNWSD